MGAMAGREERLIVVEVDCRAHGAFDTRHGAAGADGFADSARSAARVGHGAPGRRFVAPLIGLPGRDFTSMRETVSRIARTRTSERPRAPAGQISRVATRFATIALAGTSAVEPGMTAAMPQSEKPSRPS